MADPLERDKVMIKSGVQTPEGTEAHDATVIGMADNIGAAASSVKENPSEFTLDDVKMLMLASCLNDGSPPIGQILSSPALSRLASDLISKYIGKPGPSKESPEYRECSAVVSLFSCIVSNFRFEQDNSLFLNFIETLDQLAKKMTKLKLLHLQYASHFFQSATPEQKLELIKGAIEGLELTEQDKAVLLRSYSYPAYIALGVTIPTDPAQRTTLYEKSRKVYDELGYDFRISDETCAAHREYYLSLQAASQN
jgi:hypothetical protein